MSSKTRTVNVEDVTQQSKERLNDRVVAVEQLGRVEQVRQVPMDSCSGLAPDLTE